MGRALAGGRRDQVVLATKVHGQMGDDPNDQGNSRRWIIRECEASLRRLQTDWIDLYQIHRPDPSCDIDETLGALTDLVHAGKIRSFGSSTFPAVADRRGPVGGRAPGPGAVRLPSSRPTRSWSGASRPTCCPPARGTAWASSPGARWPAAGCRAGTAGPAASSPAGRARQRLPQRYDLALPENQRKLDAADALVELADEAGLTLIHLAIAFVLRHPAVTAAIIGPRTMEHLEGQLVPPTSLWTAPILDRIDEIVPPGTNVNPADAGWVAPQIAESRLRRR